MAGTAALLQLTAVFLPWWVGSNRSFGYATGVGFWNATSDNVHVDIVRVTTALAILPIVLLSFRVAARSMVHEPSAWRRDVAIAAALMLAALASGWLWPVEVPFWGSKTFEGGGGVAGQTVAGNPGLGWWVSAAAFVLVALGLWLARPTSHVGSDE